MSKKGVYHAELRKEHLPTIKAFCEDAGLNYEFVHGYEWHIRIEGILDIFPTHNLWHFLPTGERGQFKDYEELGRILIEQMQ